MCKRSHPLYRSETFKSKPVDERLKFINRNRIWFNFINYSPLDECRKVGFMAHSRGKAETRRILMLDY